MRSFLPFCALILSTVFSFAGASAEVTSTTIYVSGTSSSGPNKEAAAALNAQGKFKAACQDTCKPECTYVPYTLDGNGNKVAESHVTGACPDNKNDGKVRAEGTCLCDCGSGKKPTPAAENLSCNENARAVSSHMVLEKMFGN